MEDIVIIGAARTPIGSFNGCLSSIPATQLGKVAVEEALKRANVKPADVSEVFLGQVYTAGKDCIVCNLCDWFVGNYLFLTFSIYRT